jgi:hypothetical protein
MASLAVFILDVVAETIGLHGAHVVDHYASHRA